MRFRADREAPQHGALRRGFEDSAPATPARGASTKQGGDRTLAHAAGSERRGPWRTPPGGITIVLLPATDNRETPPPFSRSDPEGPAAGRSESPEIPTQGTASGGGGKPPPRRRRTCFSARKPSTVKVTSRWEESTRSSWPSATGRRFTSSMRRPSASVAGSTAPPSRPTPKMGRPNAHGRRRPIHSSQAG